MADDRKKRDEQTAPPTGSDDIRSRSDDEFEEVDELDDDEEDADDMDEDAIGEE
jgi:hypothetical protein